MEVDGSSPLPPTTFPFKNSDEGLLLGGAVLGFCDAIEKERGTLASGHARSGRKSKIVADERREEFAKATATKTLQAMADYWNGQAEQQVSQILDNARFHKFKRLRIIAKAHGITLLF